MEGRNYGGINLGGEMTSGKPKPNESLETKLSRIMLLSNKNPEKEFKWLMPHFNKENLISCFNALDGKKAVGIDDKTKKEYEENLEENIENLISRMKTMSYRPMPVKEVLIPKEGKGNGMRPLGISCIEDKIVQSLTAKILNAIYDPIFVDKSYGFRPGRSCHDAVKAAQNYLMQNHCEIVIDVDLKNFFGKIDHKMLTEILRIKIKDEKFIRYVVRMLKAGVLSEGALKVSEEGSPQGNIASPILSNIFAHYVIDIWFRDVVKKHTIGSCEFFRYADDICICCRYRKDAERIRKALGQRLKSKLEKVKMWCRSNRHKGKLRELWKRFCSKLRGHYQYYGVTFNTESMENFRCEAVRIFFKWMNRRSQRRSFDWDKFNKFMERFPLPKLGIHHRLF